MDLIVSHVFSQIRFGFLEVGQLVYLMYYESQTAQLVLCHALWLTYF